MKKLILLAILVSSFSMMSQDFNKQFIDIYQNHYDAKNVKKLLNNWKKNAPNDPNYYIAGFNFYWREAGKEKVEQNKNLKINDTLFAISQSFLAEGIKLNPKRLDMRLGKIFALGETKKYDEFTKEIIETIDFGKTLNFEWLWENNVPLENPISFFKNAIQDYQNTLFNDAQDADMKQISLKMTALFPDDEIVLSTLGTAYLTEGNYNEALSIFNKAFKINPKDTIIMNNLAMTFEKLNDKESAKKYYQMMIEKGDDETKKYASQKLKILN